MAELQSIDYHLLAKETIELNLSLRGKFQFDFDNQDQYEAVLAGKFEYPERPGLIYSIDQNRSTYCVRGLVTENIRQEFRKNDSLKGLGFFETVDTEIAQRIFEKIFNRRFPFQDDLMFNLSEPGLNWFLEHDDTMLKVYFKSYSQVSEEAKKIGPLGEGRRALVMLPQVVDFLKFLFPVVETSCSDKFFYISTSSFADKTFFVLLKNVFLKGRNDFHLPDCHDLPHLKGINDYLNEIASMRGFWMRIESNLHMKNDHFRE